MELDDEKLGLIVIWCPKDLCRLISEYTRSRFRSFYKSESLKTESFPPTLPTVDTNLPTVEAKLHAFTSTSQHLYMVAETGTYGIIISYNLRDHTSQHRPWSFPSLPKTICVMEDYLVVQYGLSMHVLEWCIGFKDSLIPIGTLRNIQTRKAIQGLALFIDFPLDQMYVYEYPGKIYRLSISEREKITNVKKMELLFDTGYSSRSPPSFVEFIKQDDKMYLMEKSLLFEIQMSKECRSWRANHQWSINSPEGVLSIFKEETLLYILGTRKVFVRNMNSNKNEVYAEAVSDELRQRLVNPATIDAQFVCSAITMCLVVMELPINNGETQTQLKMVKIVE